MKLIRKFGTSLTLLAALSVTAWSAGCGQNAGGKKKEATPATQDAHPAKKDSDKTKSGEKADSTDGKTKTDDKKPAANVTLPGTVDENPDGVGSGTGAGISLEDLDK